MENVLYKIYTPWDGPSVDFLGPKMSHKEFRSICIDAYKQSVKKILDSNPSYLHHYEVVNEMTKILLDKGFVKTNELSFKVDLPREATEEDRERYGEVIDDVVNYLKKDEDRMKADYEAHKLEEQTTPVIIKCEDAICKHCGNQVTREVDVPPYEPYNLHTGWNHVRDGYDTSHCSDLEGEPQEGTIVKVLHKYVRTEYPAWHRVD